MTDPNHSGETEQIRIVETDISYLAPGSFINRRFVSPGKEVNTGTYELHRMQVRDGRPIKDQFTLDKHGFVLAEYESKVTDFFDNEQVNAVYPGEVIEIVKRLTGADQVIPLGWMVRTSGDLEKHQREVVGYTHKGGVQPPAADAHVDFMPDRAETAGRELYKQHFPGGKPFTRFIASSLWRCFSGPPQDWPLALCEGSSVSADEGTPNSLIIVDEIPDREAMLADMPEEQTTMTAAIFRHNPNHRWWYFPDMTRDEVLLFKFHDSDRSRAWRVPHTAFRDTSFPDARPRESIEFRTMAYFL
jgi:hypothetical protein